MTVCRRMFCILATAMLAMSGCVGAIYHHGGPRAPAAAIPPRELWKVSGTLRDLPKIRDGNINTVTRSAAGEENPSLTIDLGKLSMFNMVVVDQGPTDEFGFPRRLSVETSVDGQNFAYRYAAPGTRRVTILCLPTPVLARYVRLKVVVPGVHPWAVAEVYLQ
ncbi:MAG TPA: hypothetical protein DCX07_00620 [Phycisphaerales bacterium]|nr:hypothetical protein [Phycisphaerales bacterium]